MSEVRVRWSQRVAGREPGYEETVERTEFIDGCLANNRLEILQEYSVLPVIEDVHVDLPVEDTVANDSFPTDAPGAVSYDIPRPRPRPRR